MKTSSLDRAVARVRKDPDAPSAATLAGVFADGLEVGCTNVRADRWLFSRLQRRGPESAVGRDIIHVPFGEI